MSQRERARLHVMLEAKKGHLSQKQAGAQYGTNKNVYARADP